LNHNKKILEGLTRAAQEDRLHHAYILSGPATAAKISCVEEFAATAASGGAGLFGAPDPAQLLERIRRKAHPDFTRIEEPAEEEEKTAISLTEQIRDLPKTLSFPPLEAAKRIVLIPDAASFNATAFNSILKILEEPPAHTMFFLLCRDPSELLQTIVSRCQVLRFAPLSDEEMRKFLGEQASDDILAFSEGALERAELLLKEEGALELRREACERLLELWEASPRIPSASAQWVEKVEDDGPASVVVDTWEILLRDLAFVAGGASRDHIRFRDYHARLAQLAVKATQDEISRRFQAINRFRVHRRLNGNLRLNFAALLAELQIFSAGQPSRA
jgi:DNA polymerase-3 subunit delta'